MKNGMVENNRNKEKVKIKIRYWVKEVRGIQIKEMI